MPKKIFFHDTLAPLSSICMTWFPKVMVIGTCLYVAIVLTIQNVKQIRVPHVGSSPIPGFARTLAHPYLLPSYLNWA